MERGAPTPGTQLDFGANNLSFFFSNSRELLETLGRVVDKTNAMVLWTYVTCAARLVKVGGVLEVVSPRLMPVSAARRPQVVRLCWSTLHDCAHNAFVTKELEALRRAPSERDFAVCYRLVCSNGQTAIAGRHGGVVASDRWMHDTARAMLRRLEEMRCPWDIEQDFKLNLETFASVSHLGAGKLKLLGLVTTMMDEAGHVGVDSPFVKNLRKNIS